MTWLLDSSVLVALLIPQHPHHRMTRRWFDRNVEAFATCAVTEGSLLRLHMRLACDKSSAAAWRSLRQLRAHPLHVFWDDGFSYDEVRFGPLQGPGQVTDAWLAELARRRGGRLATLDISLVTVHGDVAELAHDRLREGN